MTWAMGELESQEQWVRGVSGVEEWDLEALKGDDTKKQARRAPGREHRVRGTPGVCTW